MWKRGRWGGEEREDEEEDQGRAREREREITVCNLTAPAIFRR